MPHNITIYSILDLSVIYVHILGHKENLIPNLNLMIFIIIRTSPSFIHSIYKSSEIHDELSSPDPDR